MEVSNKELKELLLQYNITNKDIQGTGKHGRILKSDRMKIFNQLNESASTPNLMTTKNFDVTYLSFLDYLDIVKICQSSKNLNPICKDNVIFRNIIYNKNSYIHITPNFNIAETLKEFYSLFYKIYQDYYSFKLPQWIIEEKFKDDYKRTLIYDFMAKYSFKISDNLRNNKQLNTIKSIELDKTNIVIPFTSEVLYKVTIDKVQSDRINGTIKLSRNIRNYLIPSLLNYKSIMDKENKRTSIFDINDILTDLLLIIY